MSDLGGELGEVTYRLDRAMPAELGPVLALCPGTLEDGTVDSSATLMLSFASGASITVEQDAREEAWQVNGPGSYLAVCTPGKMASSRFGLDAQAGQA